MTIDQGWHRLLAGSRRTGKMPVPPGGPAALWLIFSVTIDQRPSAFENPFDRFTGLADVYARFRPSYPRAALDFIVSRCGLRTGAQVVDVGCGTGISARLFAGRGLKVIGIEPNADMRARAEAQSQPPGLPEPVYRDGRAEATGLPDACARAVLAAQAFHWFDPEAALREFHRILQPGGWAVLVWNERDEADPFTAAYGAIVRRFPDAKALEAPRGRAGEALLRSLLFQAAEKVCFANEQSLDEKGLLGRAFSVSYAPRDAESIEKFQAELRAVFARFQQAGTALLRYETSVYLARRPL
ncbi:MAG: class I SAM-dependent methyltransferase [Planctomycetes bacterium]|nr:class I SAM-dependent methyltransferase [Planctomycetota bacterium]